MDSLEFLEHHGVKGQKWGVRNKRQVKTSSDHKKTATLRNRKTHELSNKQLQNVNARINLEQNYRRLNPSKVKIGSDMARSILAGLGTAASVYTLANSPAGKAGIAAAKKVLSKQA
jgi:hypothetical protein